MNRYNVYDNRNLILENVTRVEMLKVVDCSKIKIQDYIDEGRTYKGRYTFEYGDAGEKYNAAQQVAFEERWKEVVAPFRNVIWVKQGGKRLRVGGAHG